MTANKQQRILSVRLPEEQLRRLKSRAAARGQSLQEAVREAVEAWMARVKMPEADVDAAFERLRGSLASADVWAQRRQDKKDEWRRDEALARLGSGQK